MKTRAFRVFTAAGLLVPALGLPAGAPAAEPPPVAPAPAAPAPALDGEALRVARAAEAARVSVVGRVASSVIAIFPKTQTGGGSGVIISEDGYALTNYHVVLDPERPGTGQVCEEVKCGLPDGKLYNGEVLGIDPTGDIAMVKIDGGGKALPAVPLGDSSRLRIGEWVFAMGNPFLLATDFRPTVTMGIVSGLHRYLPGSGMLDRNANSLVYTDCIQLDASINPGNSGGPLFNLEGELVGINGRISTRGERGAMNVGVGFAIPMHQIRNFLSDLRAGKQVEHGSLGLTVRDDLGRVIVDQVDPGGPAGEVELLDVLKDFNGVPITSANQFLNLIGVLPKGRRVTFTYVRGEKEYRGSGVLQGISSGGEEKRRPKRRRLVEETGRIAAGGFKGLGRADAVRGLQALLWVGEIEGEEGKAGKPVLFAMNREGAFRRETGTGEERQVTVWDGRRAFRREGAGRTAAVPKGELLDLLDREYPVRIRFSKDAPSLLRPSMLFDGGDFAGGRHLEAAAVPGEQGERAAFDAETFDLVLWSFHSTKLKGRIEVEAGDYREKGGLRLPYRFVLSKDGRFLNAYGVKDWELNPAVPAGFFEEP